MRYPVFAVASVLPGILLLWVLAGPATANGEAERDFAAWLAGLRQEAADRGISAATLQAALDGLEPIPEVIRLDRRQPEFTRTFEEYIAGALSPWRVETARERLRDHRRLLETIEARYAVPARILVSLWGIESRFGTYTGSFPVVGALATLAWEGRRSAFFRRELLNALEILDQGHIAPERMSGSWAGAMGQFQFMPSTFRRFAVDFDGDGRKDIWDDPEDAFASAAHYLRRAGWQQGVGWGQRVQLPRGFDTSLAGLNTVKTYRQWRRLGIRDIQGPDRRPASLLLPAGKDGPAFLVTDNFRVLMDWNRSIHFALGVGLLADEMLPAGRPKPAATPTKKD